MDTVLQLTFYGALLVVAYIGWRMFRDLADISQWIVRTSRTATMWTFYNRHKLAVALFVAWGSALAIHFGAGEGSWIGLILATAMGAIGFLGGYVNPSVMMRSQQSGARYFSPAEARKVITPDTSLIVVESAAGARGHPDEHILRPHVSGLAEGTYDDNGVMTYCGLTNLGMAFDPVINGEKLNLKVMTQIENNLVMWDETSGEPIQQVWGSREKDGPDGPAMRERPSFRMPLWAFEQAYPDGKVFLNPFPKIGENPFLAIYDRLIHKMFTWAVGRQADHPNPTFPTIRTFDERLPNKEKVYVGSVGSDHVAWTERFIRDHGNVLNVTIGGEPVVVAYHQDLDSIGMYRNTTGAPVTEIAFGGETPRGALPRLETMKAAAFWVVWQNFFPDTEVNRPPVAA